jgi:hypothetical protein
MSSTSTTRILAACLMAGVTIFSTGCFGGERGDQKNPTREGLAVPLNGLDYNVYMTRELNVRDPEDKSYYQGPVDDPQCAAGSGITTQVREQKCPTNLYGVFVSVCNTKGGTKLPARENPADFVIEDSQGNEYEPLPQPASNVFAYRARPLSKDDCIPEKGSIPDTSPIAGAVFVFRLPVQATENRPLELAVTVGGKKQRFELDI